MNLIKNVILVLSAVINIQGECDICHTTNNEACHSETEYSLCIRGEPRENFITCPEDYVCTSGPYVCYPRQEAEPSCKRYKNLCGICSANKVFACINETTISFCYGEDKPVEGAGYSYCLGDTVCDIHSKDGFCTKSNLAQPSCITSDDFKTTTERETRFLTTTPQYESTEAATTATAIEPATSRADTATTAIPTTDIAKRETPMESTTTIIESRSTSAQGTTTKTRVLTSAAPQTTPISAGITEARATPKEGTTITTATASITSPIATTKPTTTEFTTIRTELTTSNAAPKTSTPAFVLTTQQTAQLSTTREPESRKRVTTPRSPNAICRDAASTGSFYADDPTCTTFIVCYVSAGSLTGIKKSCRAGQYFPPGAVYCSSDKPHVCN